MSKKHFKAIALVLCKQFAAAERSHPNETHRMKIVAEELASTLAGFNSNFDRERFLTAAGHPDYQPQQPSSNTQITKHRP